MKKNQRKDHADKPFPDADLGEDIQRLARRLNAICRERSIGLSYLAAETGLSRSTLHNLLNGNSSPYVHTLFRMCKALDIDIRELFVPDAQSNPPQSGERFNAEEMVEGIRRMPEEKQRLALLFLDMLMKYEGKV